MSEALHHDTPSIPFEDLPDRLRRARRRIGLDQEQIAERLGVHRRTVANYETGQTEPKRALLLAWATITNVPVEWLTYGIQPCPSCGRVEIHDEAGELIGAGSHGGGNARITCFSENPTSEDSDVLRPDFGSAPEQPEGELDATVYSFPAASIDPAAQHAE